MSSAYGSENVARGRGAVFAVFAAFGRPPRGPRAVTAGNGPTADSTVKRAKPSSAARRTSSVRSEEGRARVRPLTRTTAVARTPVTTPESAGPLGGRWHDAPGEPRGAQGALQTSDVDRLGAWDAGDDAPDIDLVRRIAIGDQVALGEVYDSLAQLVYGASARILRDREAAEEVVQDTFLALWNHAERFDRTRGSLAAWLMAIARNRALDRVRWRSRRPPEAILLPADEDATSTDDELSLVLARGFPVGDGNLAEDPGEAAERGWMRDVVRAVLDTVPPLERIAIELAYDDGLTQQEIAVRLGWPLGTVKTRTRRALQRLRAALEGAGVVDEMLEGAR